MSTPASLRLDLRDLARATPRQLDALLAVGCVPGLYGPVQRVQPSPQRRQPFTRPDGTRLDKRTGVWS